MNKATGLLVIMLHIGIPFSCVQRTQDPPSEFQLKAKDQLQFKLKAGERILLTAKGKIVFRGHGSGDPDGVKDPLGRYSASRLQPQAPYGAILIRLGQGEWQFMGTGYAFTAKKDTQLTLAVNIDSSWGHKSYFQVRMTRLAASDSSIDYAHNWRVLMEQAHRELRANGIERAIDSAEAAFSQAKELFGEDHVYTTEAMKNLADYYASAGRTAEAALLWERVLELRRNQDEFEKRELARILEELGGYYVSLKRYEDAERCLKENLKLLQEVYGGYWGVDVAQGVTALAELYHAVGRTQETERLLKETLEINSQWLTGSELGLGLALFRRGNIYSELSKFKKADHHFESAFKIFKRLWGEDHPIYCQFRVGLVPHYVRTGRLKDAEQVTLRALARLQAVAGDSHPNLTPFRSVLAQLYILSGRPEKAEPILDDVFNNFETVVDTQLAFLSGREQVNYYHSFEESLGAYFSLNLQRSQTHPIVRGELYNRVLYTKSRFLFETKNIEEIAQQSKDPEIIKTYHDYRQKLDEVSYFRNLHVIEPDQFKLEQLSELQKDLIQNERNLFRAIKNLGLPVSHPSTEWQDVRRQLKPGEAAVEIFRYMARDEKYALRAYYAACILKFDASSPEIVQFPDQENLDQLLTSYQHMVHTSEIDERVPQAYWLPLERKLGGVSTVFLSMDGVFHLINPYTLLPHLTRNKLDIRLVLSTRSIGKRRQVFGAGNRAVLFGNPEFKSGPVSRALSERPLRVMPVEFDISPLPSSQNEVDQISNLLKSNRWKVESYLAKEATESRIKSVAHPLLLHISTHGFFPSNLMKHQWHDPQAHTTYYTTSAPELDYGVGAVDPMLESGLLLAGAATLNQYRNNQKEDGILTAAEATRLDLKGTKLVTLSACGSGVGSVRSGEGVFGLQRAMMLAGAHAVLLSLWKVNDDIAKLYMIDFYTEWLKHGDLQLAWVRTQVKASSEHPKVIDWGSFILVTLD